MSDRNSHDASRAIDTGRNDALIHRICLKCRYDLRGLDVADGPDGLRRCPECGEPFDPATVFIRVRPSQWEWALIALSLFYVLLFCSCFVSALLAMEKTDNFVLAGVLTAAPLLALMYAMFIRSFLKVRYTRVEQGGGAFLYLGEEGAAILHGTVFQNSIRWRKVRHFRIMRRSDDLWHIILRPRFFTFDLGLSAIKVGARATPRQMARLRREMQRRIDAARERRGSE